MSQRILEIEKRSMSRDCSAHNSNFKNPQISKEAEKWINKKTDEVYSDPKRWLRMTSRPV